MPPGFVDINGWKRWLATSLGRPGPLSAIAISTALSSTKNYPHLELAARACGHRLDRITRQIDERLLNLEPGRQIPVPRLGQIEKMPGHPPPLPRLTLGVLACSTIFATFSTRRSISPVTTKARKRPMVWPAQSISAAASSITSGAIFDLVRFAAGKQAAGRVDRIGGGGERLVQLVCQRRGHLADFAEAPGVKKFRLEFLQPLIRPLSLDDLIMQPRAANCLNAPHHPNALSPTSKIKSQRS